MRIRTHKPEFWTHPLMGRQTYQVKCIALGLMNLADDEGYLYADPALVRNAIDPFTESSVSTYEALNRLSEIEFLELKNHPERGLIGRILNFQDHQVINRPTPSKIKKYFLTENSVSTHGDLHDGSLLERKGKERKEVPPLAPKGAAPTKPTRRVRPERDIAPENQEQFDLVWKAWPNEHPVTKEEVHKGSKAQAERAFQKIISSGEATGRELKVAGILYAKAEKYGGAVQAAVYTAWDYRDRAMMHVSSFFGPEKRPYRQLLALAREEIAKVDARGAA